MLYLNEGKMREFLVRKSHVKMSENNFLLFREGQPCNIIGLTKSDYLYHSLPRCFDFQNVYLYGPTVTLRCWRGLFHYYLAELTRTGNERPGPQFFL